MEKTNLGPMGDRAFADGPEGAASRPHAYSRVHNRVSEEVKPGYAGHTPVARDTFGTSFYRDSFSHRTGNARHYDPEDGAYSDRPTSSSRVYTSNPGYRPARSRSAPGLADRERISGRPVSARKSYPAGRYFTLNNTPRGYSARGRSSQEVSL